jgi:hypothetical protein
MAVPRCMPRVVAVLANAMSLLPNEAVRSEGDPAARPPNPELPGYLARRWYPQCTPGAIFRQQGRRIEASNPNLE